MQQTFSFTSGSEKLVGELYSGRKEEKANVLFLHGAGTGNRTRFTWIQEKLLASHINSFSFDFSGQGESSGTLSASSLKKRTEEAKAALQFIDHNKPLTISGSSMGGFTALDLLRSSKPDNLLLFCPAIYTNAAYETRFDDGFTEIIRATGSWKNAGVLKNLENFTGKLLIIIGADDDVIPKGVIQLLDEHAPQTTYKKILTLPGCGHPLQTWLKENLSWREKVFREILQLIQ